MFNANLDSLTEGELDCVICGDIVVDPRLLSCQHTFCLKCLFRIVHRDRESGVLIRCPFNCSKQTITAGNINTLPRNDAIDHKSKQIRRERRNTIAPSCAWCGFDCLPPTVTSNTDHEDANIDRRPSRVCPKCECVVCETCAEDPEWSDHSFLCCDLTSTSAGNPATSQSADDIQIYDFHLVTQHAIFTTLETLTEKYQHLKMRPSPNCYHMYLEAEEVQYLCHGIDSHGMPVERLYKESKLTSGADIDSLESLNTSLPSTHPRRADISYLLQQILPVIQRNKLPLPPPFHGRDLYLLVEMDQLVHIISYTVFPPLIKMLSTMTKLLGIDVQAIDVPAYGYVLAVCHTIRSLVRECITPAVHRLLLIANAMSGAYDERLIQLSHQAPSQAEDCKNILLARAKQLLRLNEGIQSGLKDLKGCEELLFATIGNTTIKIRQKLTAASSDAKLWQDEPTSIAEKLIIVKEKERPSLLNIEEMATELEGHSAVVWECTCTLLQLIGRNIGAAMEASHKSPSERHTLLQQETFVVTNVANLATCLGSLQQLMLTWQRTELSLFRQDIRPPELQPNSHSDKFSFNKSIKELLQTCQMNISALQGAQSEGVKAKVRLALLTNIIECVCRSPTLELKTFESLSKDFADSLFPQMLTIRSQHLAMLLKGGGVGRYRLLQDQMCALSMSSLDLFYRQTILYVSALVSSEGEQLLVCTHALCDVMEQQAGMTPTTQTLSHPDADEGDNASQRLEILSSKLKNGSGAFTESLTPDVIRKLKLLEAVQFVYTIHVNHLRGRYADTEDDGRIATNKPLSQFMPSGELSRSKLSQARSNKENLPVVLHRDRLCLLGDHFEDSASSPPLTFLTDDVKNRMCGYFRLDMEDVKDITVTLGPAKRRRFLLPFFIGITAVADSQSNRQLDVPYLISGQYSDLMFFRFPPRPPIQKALVAVSRLLSSRLFFIAANACLFTGIGIRSLIRRRTGIQ